MFSIWLSIPNVTSVPGNKRQKHPRLYHGGPITPIDMIISTNTKLRYMTKTESGAVSQYDTFLAHTRSKPIIWL